MRQTSDELLLIEQPSKQSRGGKARAASLTSKQRSDIGKKAATARWASRPLRATHRGTFSQDFGIDVDCYVLDDEQKTAVITQRGMGKALGLSSGGTKFPLFLATPVMTRLIGEKLREKLSNPLIFQWGTGAFESLPPAVVHGFDVTILIDLCRVIVRADSEGGFADVSGPGRKQSAERNARVLAQANIILHASAKSGIKGLVYALAGYDPAASEVIAAFKLYVQEEARKYEREFPPELYSEWHRLYNMPMPARGKPWQFMHLTVRHVYYPLAASSGRILQLMRALKAAGGNRRKRLFQFLSEIGARALSRQIGRVLEMAQDSTSREAYERKAVLRFGGQPELDFGTDA